jgi:carboxyl-terminal processing protease
MKLRKIAFGSLILSLLACSTVTNRIVPPTPTLTPTATVTLTASPTATATVTPLVPAYIPPECANKPLATLSPKTEAAPTEEVQTDVEISKDEQLEILHEVDQTVREVYVYPDFNGKDWSAIVSRYTSMVEAGLDTDEFYSQMESMIEELGDEHSFILSPLGVEAMDEELEGENSFVGIGISNALEPEHGRVVVVDTFPGSSAEHAGIKMHDSILRVDGYPIFDEQHDRLRGPLCSAMVLTVQSPGEAPRDLLLVRQRVKGNLRIDARLVPTQDGSKIGYIFIPSFFDETLPAQIRKALEDFGRLDGLILDVRMNSGGTNIVADPILSFFTSGTLGQFVSRSDARTLEIRGSPINNSQTVPLVVMVSRDTASYAEIFAGIMRDSRGAKITGETSLGNVEVLLPYDLEDGSLLYLATEAFHPAHSNENWEETGIVPDVQAFADWGSFTFDDDPSIAAALKLLGH